MLLTLIQVEFYAGHKADESPSRFYWQDRWIEVAEIADRWYQGSEDPEWPMADYFKVSDDHSHLYLLKHDRESAEWYMAREW